MRAKAKKSYGQHFLINENLCASIASSVEEDESHDVLVEIGPGRGALTKYLVNHKKPFHCIEADRDMVKALEQSEIPLKPEQIIQADFLKFDFSSVFEENQIGVIGNFPYNISSQIMVRVIENHDRIPFMVGMFQKEVADRILSGHGSKKYGRLSVLTALYYKGRSLYDVSPNSFSPPPKVDSKVIRIDRKENVELPVPYPFIRTVVKLAFGQRRKMLRNTLKSLVTDEDLLQTHRFTLRPEQLSPEDFIDIAEELFKQKN